MDHHHQIDKRCLQCAVTSFEVTGGIGHESAKMTGGKRAKRVCIKLGPLAIVRLKKWREGISEVVGADFEQIQGMGQHQSLP